MIILAEVVGREHVLAAKTYVGGVFLQPGYIVSGYKGKQTYIGELDGQLTPRLQAVVDEFNKADLPATASTNIYGTMWDKLLVNVATGAVCAITRLPYGWLYKVPKSSRPRWPPSPKASPWPRPTPSGWSRTIRATSGILPPKGCPPSSRPRCCKAWKRV